MNRLMAMAGDKAQERTITIATYSAGPGKIVMEGTLIDRRFRENYLVTGEKRPVGVFHHMVLRILVNTTSRLIEDVDVELIEVPRDECIQVKNSLDSLKGERISKGFMRRMGSLIGGKKSCAHLRTLLISMSSTVVQGIYSIQSHQPLDFRVLADKPETEEALLGTLQNTCYVWRKGGPEMNSVLKMIDSERKKTTLLRE